MDNHPATDAELSPTDAQLLSRFTDAGDHAAYEQLVRRYCGMVYRLCRRITDSAHDSEDAVQKVFSKLAQRAHTPNLGAWFENTIDIVIGDR